MRCIVKSLRFFEIKIMNKILILLATYNGEQFIAEQIKTIKNQSKVSIDILASDNDSSDTTLEILKKYSENMNIKILEEKQKKNINKGFAINFYNMICSCDVTDYNYIAYSDQDDLFKREKYIEMIDFIEKSKAVGASSSVQTFDNSNMILKQSTAITKYDFLFEGAGQGCTFLMKKNFFREFQEFVKTNRSEVDNFYFHDWLTYLYCRSSNYSWAFNSEPLTHYRIHTNNVAGSKYSLAGISLRIRKLFNGWYYEQLLTANKLARIINKNIVDLENISTFKLLHILIFNGRRKLSERALSLVGIIFSRFARKK